MLVLCFLDVLINEFGSSKLLDCRILQTIRSSSVRQMLLSPFGEVQSDCGVGNLQILPKVVLSFGSEHVPVPSQVHFHTSCILPLAPCLKKTNFICCSPTWMVLGRDLRILGEFCSTAEVFLLPQCGAMTPRVCSLVRPRSCAPGIPHRTSPK